MEVFVARQPIFDRHKKVFGYELLFRKGFENCCCLAPNEGDAATAGVINSFILFGIEALTGGKRSFINFTESLIKNDTATLLPKELLAIEVLENVEPKADTVLALQRLKEKGYMLALDDFTFDMKYKPFFELADIIKVDFLNTTSEQRREFVKQHLPSKVNLLAEKVETQEEFEQACEMGFRYFQGYFFSKPEILSTRDVPSYKQNYFFIIKEVNQTEPDFSRIEAVIKRDLAFSYKLLRYINSAAFGFNQKITSLRQALVLLGIKEVRKWVSLNALRGMLGEKPDALMSTAITRARFCEMLAPRVGLGNHSSELFLMGMFSLIDAFLDRPLPEILNELALSTEIKQALLGEASRFRETLDLAIAYERGDWSTFEELVKKLSVDEQGLSELYTEAVNWGNYFDKL